MESDRLGRWLARAEDAMAVAAALILVVVTLLVGLEVVMRYGFRAPIVWVVEISEYALLYITFLGTAWALREGGHVRVDVFFGMFPPGLQRAFAIVAALLGLAVAAVLLVFGGLATWSAFEQGRYKPTVIEFPTWIVLAVIPAGSLVLALRFARQLAALARGRHEARAGAERPL